ncbi:tigger transposable element-derived protein 6-like [Bradysia coprophila]|uniref:tigger transposable element-derived protein 6-like n=1 Tax=Bradysia coprophila TaxID=38358 RepID=UPI00187DBAB1|nr:tigger transposable element-derived protein 6-like [Bradysia coprophila]
MSGNRSYTDQDVNRALEEILNGASISESARKFGIPRSTLSEKRSGHLPTEHKMGPPTILSPDEESLLEKWIFHVGTAGFPVTKDQLLYSVQKLLNHSKIKTIFTDNRPGRKWYEAFTRRHPLIIKKQCQNLTAARASVTEEGLRSWFEEVRQYLANTGNVDILNDPKRIFNMDESGFFLNPKPGKVIRSFHVRFIYTRDEKEMITVLIGGNASGVKTPPLVMFPYQRLPANIVNDMPDNWAFGRSLNGWMTAESFYEYVTNCFYPWLVESSIVLPIVLFVDGHSSHITYHLSEFCREKKIILIALHPNATHLLQPMDVSVFHSLKCHWLKAALNYPKNNNGARITRDKFSKVLQQVSELRNNLIGRSKLYL